MEREKGPQQVPAAEGWLMDAHRRSGCLCWVVTWGAQGVPPVAVCTVHSQDGAILLQAAPLLG